MVQKYCYFCVQSNAGETLGTFSLNGVLYFLHQLHVHTKSEHTYGGISETQGDLEIHFVHLGESGEPAVIGVICNEGTSTLEFWCKFKKVNCYF